MQSPISAGNFRGSNPDVHYFYFLLPFQHCQSGFHTQNRIRNSRSALLCLKVGKTLAKAEVSVNSSNNINS